MQIVAPDILDEARGLPPYISAVGLIIGALLWSIGGRTHRFWLAMCVTLTAGMLGLTYGKHYGMQPLVAGLLLAICAGALALSLVRILLFAAGGLAALGLIWAVAPGWDEPIAVFLVGGLIGVLLYRFWITTFASLIGSLLVVYSALALLERLHMFKKDGVVVWAERNGPLLNWGFASLVVTGALVQFLLDRRRRRKAQHDAEPVVADLLPPPAPPPPKPARLSLWAWGEKLIHRRAG